MIAPRAARLMLGLSLGLLARTADAHLIAPGHATVHVVNDAAFVVLAVPVSALHGADDDGDGELSLAELDHHHAALEAEIDRRFAVADADGSRPAATARVDLVLSPEHQGAQDRSTTIVALKHVTFAAAPRAVDVRTDLFGARPGERELSVSAREGDHRQRDGEAEAATLTPASPAHRFAFAAPIAPTEPASSKPTALVALVLFAGLGLGLRLARRAPAPRPAG